MDIFPKTYKWPTVHERHLISLIIRKMQIKPTAGVRMRRKGNLAPSVEM